MATVGLEAIEGAQVLPGMGPMGIQAPKMDDIVAIRRFRVDDRASGLHIVALTSLALGEDGVRRASGAYGPRRGLSTLRWWVWGRGSC